MRRFLVFSLIVSALFCPLTPAQAKKEPLVERVRSGIDWGVNYLRDSQRGGHWEADTINPGIFGEQKGGQTALVVLALLNSGVPVTDAKVKAGLSYLRDLDAPSVYTRSLQTMVFAEARQQEDSKVLKEEYRKRIADNAAWLLAARYSKDKEFLGWSYRQSPFTSDNSNTQFAMLGLWAARQAGVEVPEAAWKEIRDFYLRTQQKEGSWGYRPYVDPASMTMTTAGLGGLLISAMELNLPCAIASGGGRGRACGSYPDTEATTRAISWVSRNFTVDLPQKAFYHLYGLERAGRLTGDRFLGDHDWYREGCDFLVGVQKADGSFASIGAYDKWPVVSTSFALLFLSKGRTPVLVSKLVHFNRERPDDRDWNNDRNDLRHLVAFTSEHLFKGLPLAWQSFDITRPLPASPSEDDIAQVASEMLQSPVLYITGHRSPLNRITAIEKKILLRYVEGGGFIIAEACCGSPEFDAGFKEFVKDVWPDNDLAELKEDHDIWRGPFTVTAGDPYRLYAVSQGCREVLVYSPQDMSCFWENNLLKDGRGDRAFKLGANIIAYATAKEPPKPRLTEVKVVRGKEEKDPFRRGHLKAAQLTYRGDWRAARLGLRNLMDHLNRHAGIHVVRQNEELKVTSSKLLSYKFLYMHGRGKFSFPEEDLQALRFNLEQGALLFADASCGNKEFDDSFRAFAQALFKKELELVPAKDLLYSEKLAGVELNATTIKGRLKAGEEARGMVPYMEGIRLEGRWVVLYSKIDIGCALERHAASSCPGYTPDSALRIATAAVLYTFWPEGEGGK